MSKTKIVLIGAGSASFGVNSLADLFRHRSSFRGSTVALCDINLERLARVARLADRLNAASGAPFQIQWSADYRELLQDAEFVFTSVEADRLERWKLDWEIPFKYGIKHVLGENGGPGGLSHALRTIDLLLGIAEDVESLAPDAYLINYTNPLSRVCLALTRYTRLQVIGLCHQIYQGYYIVGHILGLTPQIGEHFAPVRVADAVKTKIDLKTAGLNHLTWITDMRERDGGRDLYPEFRERLLDFDPAFQPLSRRLLDVFGLFPTGGDEHVGEYFSFANETSNLAGYDFVGRELHMADLDMRVDRARTSDTALGEFLEWKSGERAADVAAALLNDLNTYEETVNVPNNGAISGLPDWAVVEVPAIVSGAGVMPLRIGSLPPAITAVLNQQVSIQDRVVEAAVHGDRQAALQALLVDPLVSSYIAAEQLLDEILTTHAAYLPRFGREKQRAHT